MAPPEELTAVQLAQLTFCPDVFSSVADIEEIFDRLPKLPGLSDHFRLGFEKKLVAVLPGIDATILQDIPNTTSGASYKSLIAGINTIFSEIPAPGKMDIYNYIVAFRTQKSEVPLGWEHKEDPWQFFVTTFKQRSQEILQLCTKKQEKANCLHHN
ncbi:uncharacterized protein [Struthio camelus]|uniref:uncharacterized protein isoform X12 n=1 Tax=Struthio camelus TaxID=8801 RepID=UPI003603D3F2